MSADEIVSGIGTAYLAVRAAYEEYKPLHDEYVKAMQESGDYVVPTAFDPEKDAADIAESKAVLVQIKKGRFSKQGIKGLVDDGVIELATVEKPAKLIAAETLLEGRTKEYFSAVNAAVLPFEFQAEKKGRKKSNNVGSTRVPKVGDEKFADILADVAAINPGAQVTRIEGTYKVRIEFPNGHTYERDAYGQSFLKAIREAETPEA